MSAVYRTQEGDTLDRICWKFYGKQSGAVEHVLEANHGLAGKGPIFEAGIALILPDLPQDLEPDTAFSLWD